MSNKPAQKSKTKSATSSAKKPLYEQWWFWLAIVFGILSIYTIALDLTRPSRSSLDQTVENFIDQTMNKIFDESEPSDSSLDQTVENFIDQTMNKIFDESESESSDPSSSMTPSQRNALRSAQSYLEYMSFSYSGLIEQLEYEKYPHADAVYAADHCGADWYEQAAKSAASYLEYMSFSHDGLVDQLEYEGFTHDQAEYGVSQSGL